MFGLLLAWQVLDEKRVPAHTADTLSGQPSSRHSEEPPSTVQPSRETHGVDEPATAPSVPERDVQPIEGPAPQPIPTTDPGVSDQVARVGQAPLVPAKTPEHPAKPAVADGRALPGAGHRGQMPSLSHQTWLQDDTEGRS